MDIVGENIRKIRKMRGISQKELAAKADMDPSNLSKLERGEYTWTKDNLEPVAKALGVTVPEFFTSDPRIPILGLARAGFGSIEPNYSAYVLGSIDAKLGRIVELSEALAGDREPPAISDKTLKSSSEFFIPRPNRRR